MAFSVMTFNVRGAYFDDGPNCWPNRADLNLELLKRHAPDLIGFQEVQRDNVARYERELSDYLSYIGLPVDIQTHEAQRNAIYWRHERFEFQFASGFYLGPSPETWQTGWGCEWMRAATWVRLRERETGSSFVHLNTHLSAMSGEARDRGAALIVQRLTEIAPDAPVVVTGDFNARPGSRAHETFTRSGFADAFETVDHSAPPTTSHGFQGLQPFNADARIDWILINNGFKAHSYAVVTDAEPPVYPSDHFPVVSKVELS